MLSDALAYAEAGVAVLPLHGKVPVGRLVPHGSRNATTDPNTLRAWWDDAGYNIGGVVPAGQLVLDVDPRNGGDLSLQALVASHPLPPTRFAVTGGGGWHYWFCHDAPKALTTRRLPGIDLKTPGSYVVMPPSRHPETKSTYAWGSDSYEVAQLPNWLATLLDRERVAAAEADDGLARVTTVKTSLSEVAWELLEGRAEKTWGDTTASGVFWSCLFFLANAGWALHEVFELAKSPTYPALHRKYRQRGPGYVRQQYGRVLELAKRANPAEERRLLRFELALIVAGEAGAWSGKAGINEYRLLRQFLDLARRLGRTELTYSQLDMMQDGGWERRPTLRDVLKRVETGGWLIVTAKQHGFISKSYRLCIPVALHRAVKAREKTDGFRSTTGAYLASQLVPSGHDAFAGSLTEGTLTHGSAFILQALVTATGSTSMRSGNQKLEKKGSVSSSYLSVATGLSRETVRRHLALLTKQGLLEKASRTTWSISPHVDLTAVALRQGTDGAAEKLSAHAKEARAEQTARLQDPAYKRRRRA